VATKSSKILILEHAHSDAEMIEAQLHRVMLPVQTKRVSTKEMFLKAIPEFSPDIIIADYGVPKFDILAALRQAQVDMPGMPWIVLSSAGTEDVAVACMKAGATDYINKKNLSRLGPLVKNLVEKRATAPEAPAAPPAPPPAEVPAAPPPPQPAADPLQRLFQLTVEHTSDLIAFVDLSGRRIYNNPAYGLTIEDPDVLRGTDSFADIHPDDRETVRRVFMESLRTGTGRRIEYRLYDLHGEIRYIESQGTVLREADGRPVALAVIGHDITARKRAELGFMDVFTGTAALFGEAFFQRLVEKVASALDVAYALVSEVTAPGGDSVRALAYWQNGQLTPRFEYSVAGTTCERVLAERKVCYYPSNLRELFPAEHAIAAMNAVCYLGLPLISTSGELLGHMFIMDAKPLADYPRASMLLTAVAHRAALEIGRLRELDRIRSSEASFRSILTSLNDGVIMTDMADIITYVNGRTLTMMGYGEGEMLGKSASALLLPKEEWENLQMRNRERRRGIAERYATRMRKKDGSYIDVLLSAGPFRDQHGHIVGTVAIVTEKSALPDA